MKKNLNTDARHAAMISNQTRTISDEAVSNIELLDIVVVVWLVEIVTSAMMRYT